jgi:hypothetical protein
MLPQVPGMCELTFVVRNTNLQIRAQFKKRRNNENSLFTESKNYKEAKGDGDHPNKSYKGNSKENYHHNLELSELV